MSFTTGSYPPFANPHIAELAAQLDASLGVANGLSQYLNQSLGEAISANAVIHDSKNGSPQAMVVNDHAAICYTTASPLTLILPPIGGVGRMVEAIKVTPDANTVTVNTLPGISFVDGTTTFVLYNQNDYVDIIANPVSTAWAIRGYRQRGASNNSGFAGLAGSAQIQQTGLNQSISNNTITTVVFNGKNFDSGLPNPYWNSASPNQFKVPAAGIYQISGSMQFTAATESAGEITLYLVAGGAFVAVNATPIAAAGQSSSLNVTGLAQLTSGALVILQLFQTSTGSININSNSENSAPVMNITQVG